MHAKARGLVDAVERILKYDIESPDRKRIQAQLSRNWRAFQAAKEVDGLWR